MEHINYTIGHLHTLGNVSAPITTRQRHEIGEAGVDEFLPGIWVV